MYTSFYGLRERPFDLTPNPRYLYLSEKHREALSNIRYGISGRKGITLLVGEAGTGKTTVLHSALADVDANSTQCICLSNPTLTRSEFYEFLSVGFGLSERAGRSKARFLIELQNLLARRQKTRQTTALVIDEAQSLPVELLEEVRLLANLQTSAEQLFPLVLVGQPQLADVLERPDMRQVKQRVALRCELKPLDLAESAAYVAGRIRIAGGDVRNVFTKESVCAIYKAAAGVPRTIGVICDNSMVSGFAGNVKPIGPDIVAEVCRDFKLVEPAAARQPGQSDLLPSTGSSKSAEVLPVSGPREFFSQIFRRRRLLTLRAE